MSFFIRKGGTGGGKNTFAGKKRKADASGKAKKMKKMEDEEIYSDGSDIDPKEDVGYESDEDLETAEEKKLRLAKVYLQEIEKELEERGEAGGGEEDEDGVQRVLKEEVEAERGKLRREITATLDFDSVESSHLQDKRHKLSITCICLSKDGKYLYSASKDKGLLKWKMPSGEKLFRISGGKRGEEESVEAHCHTITCLAVTSDGMYLATGDTNNTIYIWTTADMKRVHVFKGHRADISGLVFRKGTHTLYSSSYDRSVKIWSVDEKAYVETLFGHQDRIMDIDAGSRERAITVGGRDKSVRVWKIVEESQLVFNVPTCSIDLVRLLNEEHWVTAGEDGHLAVWGVMRKKPLAMVEKCHGVDSINGEPNWVSSLGTLYNSDMVATGSRDGSIRIWSVGEAFKSIIPVRTIELAGFINCLSIGEGGTLLVAGVGQEHRLGRWWREPAVKNRIHLFKISHVKS
eukprot:TRINITY_DN3135_c0_g1_i3.p1 TRINITY_DN3135_c0_g1~~TRINITY_DN3135_c0_g1_i3.p1  ORF type:complete len:461 (-),score=88.09 TRINITY_DN3135_c0_g1_i3:2-1384(-)